MQEQIKVIEERIKQRAIIFSSLLRGILIAKPNSTQNEQQKLIQGGEQMKYQGISVIKHKTCNTWYARYRMNGKQFYVCAKTQKECYNKLKIALKQKRQQELKTIHEPQQGNQITFIEWYNKWLELYKQDVKQTTKIQYEVCIKHLQEILNKPLNKITGINFIEQLNKISGERMKQKVYELANSVFEKAVANDIINKNPLVNVDKPKHKRINGKALTSEDEKQFEKILIANNADIFLICLYQGLRRSEALALTGKDIDLKNKLLTINKSLNQNNKIDTTKNIYSNRVMPIFDKAIPILKKYAEIQTRIFPYTQKSCEKLFNELISQLNNTYKIHSLRHTFITRCQECNIPLHIIQKWVGHSIGSNVTSQVYTHTRELAELENIDKINNYK